MKKHRARPDHRNARGVVLQFNRNLLLRCVRDLKKFNIKDQRRLRRNRTTSTLAVSKHVRHDQLALAADLH